MTYSSLTRHRGAVAAALGLSSVLSTAVGGALLMGCSSTDETGGKLPVLGASTAVSATLAITQDDKTLWVVNQDSDSVSVIDTVGRVLVDEILLGAAPPARHATTKRFEPAVTPRSVALWQDGKKVYVAGQTSNKVYVIDGQSHAILKTIDVPAEPTGLACAPDGSAVYVVSQQAARISKIDPTTDEVLGGIDIRQKPWGVTVSPDGTSLFITHIMLEPGLTVIDAATFALRNTVIIKDEPVPVPFVKTIPNGPARGLFNAVPRPTTGELWIPHILLAVGTAQTDNEATNLDFESTVFPAVSTVSADGATEGRRLNFKPPGVTKGAFTDSVSGPHGMDFTPDGKLAIVALGQSEDLLVFDAETGTQRSLVRPLPSTMLEGIVVNHAGTAAYVDGRNTHDITVLKIDQANTAKPVSVDGGSIDRILVDPMPADLRLGQRLFYTANSSAEHITKNFWVACTSCHIEGGSDAVTWVFKAGPRDTPSNMGGMLGAGFMFKTAARNLVQQYDETIRVEQGGNYVLGEPSQQADLDALADYVNYAIPLPENPFVAADGSLNDQQQRGAAIFETACSSCHYGEMLTDSGAGNPTLDLAGPIMLHDVGTCVTKGDIRDRKSTAYDGSPREACEFDTPTLRGIFASAPYFHDGSALTLRDVIDRLSFSSSLSEAEKVDLVEYVKTL